MNEERTKLLLAEDDPNLGKLLNEYLDAKGYDVKLAENGKKGFDYFKRGKFDLCLLDVMMPIKDGFTLAKEIRAMNADVPIIFLTAKSMKEDTIEGFSVGADDYITKPFSMEELLARLKAILRRTKVQSLSANAETVFTIGKYVFDYNSQTLTLGKKKTSVTTKEADLLKLLCINVNNVLTREFALNTIWFDDNFFTARSMDVYIGKLRKLLSGDSKVEILNIHGRGFKLLIN